MNELKSFHDAAMRHVDLANIARVEGNSTETMKHFRSAFELEAKAARMVSDDLRNEPTRSVLHRSAATLALDCNEFLEAERLIASGLSGHPPNGIAEELRDLLEQVHFQRHLVLHGISLSLNEMQLSLSGQGIGFGMALVQDFTSRVKTTETILYRTYSRLQGESFKSGRPKKRIFDKVELFMSPPKFASFAVTLRVGSPQHQLKLFPDLPERALEEVLDCLDLFQRDEKHSLERRIGKEDYYRNFVSLARELSPDGKRVKQVGLTVVRDSKSRCISLTKPRKRLEVPTGRNDADVDEKPETIAGRLVIADATKDRVGILQDSGRKILVHVPEGLDDVVRTRWDEQVIVECEKRGTKLVLVEIDSPEEEA